MSVVIDVAVGRTDEAIIVDDSIASGTYAYSVYFNVVGSAID